MKQRDQHLLAKAFFEAERASWLLTAPNPRVGALALSGGHIIGYGYHAAFGGPHAEEAALRDAGAWNESEQAPIPGRVDEMIVSLEPCSAQGKKRPPCTDTLIAAGVQRVLVAAVDPDPRHAGAGLEVLRAAGIQVDQADPAFQKQFEQQNAAFLRALAIPNRPWVLLKWAASLDGKLAAEDGTSQWITGAEARAEVHQLRALSDGVLAGAGTLRCDDPSLTARLVEASAGMREAIGGRQPKRILCGGGESVAQDARILATGGERIWILEHESTPATAIQAAGDAILRVAKHGGELDLKAALAILSAEHGVRRLLVEGGARIHGSLLAAGCVDAVVRYEAPLLIGGSRAACDGPSFPSPGQALRLEQEERAELGVDLRRAFLVAPQKEGPSPGSETENDRA